MKLTNRELEILSELEVVYRNRLTDPDQLLISYQYVQNVDICLNFKKLGYVTGQYDAQEHMFNDAKITKKGLLIFKLESMV